MKLLSNPAKRRPRRNHPTPSARLAWPRIVPREKWLLLAELEEGPDEAVRDLTDRLERGQLIRGRAL
jgi:hypothetical protein